MPERVSVAILISGRGSNMSALISAATAVDCPYRIDFVISNNPDAAGLGIAREHGIPTFAQSHKGMKRTEFDAIVDAELRRAGIRLVVLAGYMRLMSTEFVTGWVGRILNIHPSLLPLYKGLDTHQRAIEAGDREAGCSVHIVTPELDDGPVIAQARVPILPGDDAETLAARVLVEEHKLYPKALTDFIHARGDQL